MGCGECRVRASEEEVAHEWDGVHPNRSLFQMFFSPSRQLRAWHQDAVASFACCKVSATTTVPARAGGRGQERSANNIGVYAANSVAPAPEAGDGRGCCDLCERRWMDGVVVAVL